MISLPSPEKRALKPYHWILLFILLLSMAFASMAQTSPTFIEWVKLNQTYMQIKVGKDGVYRIPSSVISQNFPGMSTLNAAGFQLFRRGREQAIFVNSGSDNFLGEKLTPQEHPSSAFGFAWTSKDDLIISDL